MPPIKYINEKKGKNEFGEIIEKNGYKYLATPFGTTLAIFPIYKDVSLKELCKLYIEDSRINSRGSFS